MTAGSRWASHGIAPRPVDADAPPAGVRRAGRGSGCRCGRRQCAHGRSFVIAERGEIAHGVDPGQEEVRAAREGGECRKALVHLADRPLRDGEVQCAVLGAADRVVLVAEFVECLVVDPHVLRELELTNQVGADDERGDAAIHTVVGRALGQRGSVGRAAADHPATVHVVRGVTRIQPAGVRAERTRVPERIHLLVVEVVVAHRIRAELGIVLVRAPSTSGAPLRQRPMNFAASSSCSSGVSAFSSR